MFKLTNNFITQQTSRPPQFGFNGLGEFVFRRTYSRIKDGKQTYKKDGVKEEWWEVIQRVTEGVYSIQMDYIEGNDLGWNAIKGQYSAQEMYDRMFDMKFLPGGRSLWSMGTPIVHDRGMVESLFNCAAVSTSNIDKEPAGAFALVMGYSMLGVGCLAPNTLIMTSNGARRIEDLNGTATNVIVNGYSYHTPKGSWCTGIKNLYKISTKEGYTINLTEDHRVRLYTGKSSDADWVTTSELKPADRIVINDHTSSQHEWNGEGTYEQGYLLGIFWGDGYFSRDPVANVHDKDIGSDGIADEALRCTESPSVKRNKDAQGWRRKKGRECRELSIGTWVRKFGITIGNKYITTEIEQTSADFHRGFLRGAFDADGGAYNFNATRTIRLTQTSYEDLQAVQRMLLKFGIYSKIYKKRDAGVSTFSGEEYKTKTCWDLHITRDSIPKFADHIGFSHTTKASKLVEILESSFYKREFYATVASVEPAGKSEVWDMTVSNIHAMDANGFYVHNCGFDVAGANKLAIKGTNRRYKSNTFVIPDSREGWVESLEELINSYVYGTPEIQFDYSLIRPKGASIKTFGGTASGPEALEDLHEGVRKVLEGQRGRELSTRGIVDIMNMIGVAVVAGSTRRTALLAIGQPDDQDFLNLKNYDINPERAEWGWTCLAGDTMINTTVGVIPISELVNIYYDDKDVRVFLNSISHQIGGVKKTGTKPTLLIETKGGPSISATNNHLFMTTRGWKEAITIRPGDELLISDNSKMEEPHKNLQETNQYKRGYLIGHLIGDGTFTVTTTTGSDIARIQTYSRDPGCNSMRDYIESIFDFETRSDFAGFSKVYDEEKNGGWQFISAKKFTEKAAEYKVVKGNKTITNEIEAASIPFVAGIASGLFDTDGWIVTDKGSLAIESTDFNVIERLQRILIRLGIKSRWYKTKNPELREITPGKPCNCSTAYRLTVSGYGETRRFIELYGLHNENKLNTWNKHEPPKFTKSHTTFVVDSITAKAEVEDVYDIFVPSVSAFEANGLYVHNSNNSILAKLGMDYSDIADRILMNGEPGILWLENMQKYGRMGDDPNYKDLAVTLVNPCGETSLESHECCNLAELYLNRIDSFEDYLRTIKFATIYAKTLTTVRFNNLETNRVNFRNRRMGISLSGIAQFIEKRGIDELIKWMEEGYKEVLKYDEIYSRWMGVPQSIKTTTLKPSGTASRVTGSTSGVHYPTSRYYIKRVTTRTQSPLIQAAKDAGYEVEPVLVWSNEADKYVDDSDNCYILFPVDTGEGIKPVSSMSIWEQLGNIALIQERWCDNQTSSTVSIDLDRTTKAELVRALEIFQYQLKGVSLLPLIEEGVYPQMPEEAITADRYKKMFSKLTQIDYSGIIEEAVGERYCAGDSCEVEVAV